MASLNCFFKMFVITSNSIKRYGLIRKGIKTKFCTHDFIRETNFKRSFCSKEGSEVVSSNISKPVEINTILGNIESDFIVGADIRHLRKGNESALDECKENISDITPYIKPSYNLAAYVNKSPMLQELVKLGVNLYKLEKTKGVPEFLLRLNFEENVKGHLR